MCTDWRIMGTQPNQVRISMNARRSVCRISTSQRVKKVRRYFGSEAKSWLRPLFPKMGDKKDKTG
jgi:hypothetical protein